MIRVSITSNYRVDCSASILAPLPRELVWMRMSDLGRFASLDPFHRHIVLPEGMRVGSRILIKHAFLTFRTLRRGRVMKWRDGIGYAFTDLCMRDPRVAFPHSYEYLLGPHAEGWSAVTIRVRGRWTARFLPRFAVRLWLRWVMMQAAMAVRNELLDWAIRVRRGEHG
jgi:hypothetical protein